MAASGGPCDYCDSGEPAVMGRRCLACRRVYYNDRYQRLHQHPEWVPRSEVGAMVRRSERNRLDLIADYAERFDVPLKTVVARYGSVCYNKHRRTRYEEAERWSLLIRGCPW